jgi:hypothetical protein
MLVNMGLVAVSTPEEAADPLRLIRRREMAEIRPAASLLTVWLGGRGVWGLLRVREEAYPGSVRVLSVGRCRRSGAVAFLEVVWVCPSKRPGLRPIVLKPAGTPALPGARAYSPCLSGSIVVGRAAKGPADSRKPACFVDRQLSTASAFRHRRLSLSDRRKPR